MLQQRVITALVLVLILGLSLAAPGAQWFAALTLLAIVAAVWEWVRLNAATPIWALPWAIGVGALCAVLWLTGVAQQTPVALWAVAGLAWVVLGAWALHAGVGAWGRTPRGWRLALGTAALVVTWLAVVQAHGRGVAYLFSVFSLVWVADIGAYFAGRAWGTRWIHRRLAPSISPGKSWEGAIGGAIGVLVLALAWLGADPAPHSLYAHLASHGAMALVGGVIFLTAMSVVGDLFESLVKRSAGVKDSSALLPGHGGVLDRIDALLPTLPLALLLSVG